MRKIREYNTDIYIEEQGSSNISLLQSPNRQKLSKFFSNQGKVRAIINCSYFTTSYVLGRNQGDLFNDAPDQDFWSVIVRKDNSYGCAKYTSAEERYDIVAGFSPAVVLIKDGQDVELVSNAIGGAKSRLTTKNPNTAFGFLKNGKAVLIVNEGRSSSDGGLTGRELRTALKKYYNFDLLVLLDGGGSSELIIEGKVVNTLSDGSQRPMFNGIAFIGGEGNMPTTIEPVERNTEVNQLKVLVDDLRVRKEPSTNAEVLGMAQKGGIYNDLEQVNANGYVWHKIAQNQFIAFNSEWVELLPKQENEEVIRLKAEIELLNKQNKELTERIEKALSELM